MINNLFTLITNWQVEKRTLDGRDYLVVPVVFLVEGVHNGSRGPIFYPREELKRSAAFWNGRPVVVGHPTDPSGLPISANSPSVLEKAGIGWLYNVHYDEAGKLKGEMWIDIEKARKAAPNVLMSIEQGKLEVSTGLYSQDDKVEGEWNGEKYKSIARNILPDHLAVLPDSKGACSWEDGCGAPRVNTEGGDGMGNEIVDNALKYRGTESTPWSAPTLEDFGVKGRWQDLSREERARIASHFLIGSADAETFGDLKLPVVNPKTGKLNERALRAVISGRGAQVKGVPEDVLKRARRRAYELLNKEFNADLEIPEHLLSANDEKHVESIARMVFSWIMNKLGITNKEVGDMTKEELVNQLIGNEATSFTEDDREWLMSLEEEKLMKLFPKANEKKGDASGNAAPTDNQAKTDEPANAQGKADEPVDNEGKDNTPTFKTLEELLAAASPEVREFVENGVVMLKEKKGQLVQTILSKSDKFTREQLEGKSIAELEAIAELAQTVNYAGKAGGGAPKVEPLGLPTINWEVK